MPRFDYVRRQRTAAYHILKHHVVCGFLIFKQPAYPVVIEPLHRMGAHHTGKPLGNELFRYAAPQRVEPLDLSGFYGKRTNPLPQPTRQEPILCGTRL